MSNDIPEHYWKNLLQLSTIAGSSSGKTFDANADMMSTENRAWLEEVMKDLVKETDPSRQLDTVIDTIGCYLSTSSPFSQEDVDKLEDLCYRLQELLAFADLTNKFVKKGGLNILKFFLNYTDSPELQCSFCECIQIMAENNPDAQQILIDAEFLKFIVGLLENPSLAKTFRLKLLGAVSASVRSYEPAFEYFISSSFSPVLSRLIQDVDSRIAAKAARVISTIAYTMQDTKFAKSLSVAVAENYTNLVKMHIAFGDDIVGELEYIREYLEQFVAIADLDADTLDKLCQALNSEFEAAPEGVSLERITALLRKFNRPTKG